MTKEEVKVLVDGGVCKMLTLITAKENDMGLIDIDIKSDCPNVLKMSWSLEPMSPYAEVEAEFSKSSVYKLADESIPHTACPVPAGIIKALEVAGDLGLKRDATIHFVQPGEEVKLRRRCGSDTLSAVENHTGPSRTSMHVDPDFRPGDRQARG